MSRTTKDFDYQLDLTPFISLLSVCICFLLLTVAWFQIGALSVKQVMGGDAQGVESEDTASLWIYMKAQKRIEVRVKKGDKSLSQKFINPENPEEDSFDFKEFTKYIVDLRKKQSDLSKAFIFPQKQAVYEDIVKIMDSVRQAGIFNMGLSPI